MQRWLKTYHIIAFILINATLVVVRDDTLVHVTVLARHGERTPDDFIQIPELLLDTSEEYWPYGIGGLTLNGKRQMYELGKILRTRYDKFLGQKYSAGIIGALSSPKLRVRMSLATVLASLFPPVAGTEIEIGLKWQPIIYTYMEKDEDYYFSQYERCPTITVPKNDQSIDVYHLFEYLSQHVGVNVTNNFDVYCVCDTIQTMMDYGISPPAWVRKIYPEPFKSAYQYIFTDIKNDPHRLNLSINKLGNKIMEEIDAKTGNGSGVGGGALQERKMSLYLGHDINVAGLMGLLHIYNKQFIGYGAYIILELHLINNIYGVQVYFGDNANVEPISLTIPGCDAFCPLDRVASITRSILISRFVCD